MDTQIKGKVHSIESFGTVDGPGTRFVVFLKGCNLRCLYCHNPDTWSMDGATEMSVSEILEKYEKVEEFITGGLTISGGEPLLQLDFLLELFKEAKKRNIHIALDTSGSILDRNNKLLMDKLTKVLSYVDLVLLDIKHIDNDEHIKLTGFSNKKVFEFAHFLDELKVDTWVRQVAIPGITLDDKELFKLGNFLGQLDNITGVEILPYHTMAIPKYESMGWEYPLKDTPACSKEAAKRARSIVLFAMNEAKMSRGN